VLRDHARSNRRKVNEVADQLLAAEETLNSLHAAFNNRLKSKRRRGKFSCPTALLLYTIDCGRASSSALAAFLVACPLRQPVLSAQLRRAFNSFSSGVRDDQRFPTSTYRPFNTDDTSSGGAIGFSIFAAAPRVLHVDSDHDTALVLAAAAGAGNAGDPRADLWPRAGTAANRALRAGGAGSDLPDGDGIDCWRTCAACSRRAC
jgi:hypothetical protein